MRWETFLIAILLLTLGCSTASEPADYRFTLVLESFGHKPLPVKGCPGCSTTGGTSACPIHRTPPQTIPLVPKPRRAAGKTRSKSLGVKDGYYADTSNYLPEPKRGNR